MTDIVSSRFAQQEWRERIEGASSASELARVAAAGDELDGENVTRLVEVRRDGLCWAVGVHAFLSLLAQFLLCTLLIPPAASTRAETLLPLPAPFPSLFSRLDQALSRFSTRGSASQADFDAAALDSARPALASLLRGCAADLTEQQAAACLVSLPGLGLALEGATLDAMLRCFLRRVVANRTTFVDPAVVAKARGRSIWTRRRARSRVCVCVLPVLLLERASTFACKLWHRGAGFLMHSLIGHAGEGCACAAQAHSRSRSS